MSTSDLLIRTFIVYYIISLVATLSFLAYGVYQNWQYYKSFSKIHDDKKITFEDPFLEKPFLKLIIVLFICPIFIPFNIYNCILEWEKSKNENKA